MNILSLLRRTSYGGRLPQARFGIPWGPFKLYYFRNYSARISEDGVRGGFTSHGVHLRLPMVLPFAGMLAIIGFVLIGGPVGLTLGLIIFLLRPRTRRKFGALVVGRNFTTRVTTINPPGWGSFRIRPERRRR